MILILTEKFQVRLFVSAPLTPTLSIRYCLRCRYGRGVAILIFLWISKPSYRKVWGHADSTRVMEVKSSSTFPQNLISYNRKMLFTYSPQYLTSATTCQDTNIRVRTCPLKKYLCPPFSSRSVSFRVSHQ